MSMYLQIPSIDSDVSSKGHEQWIEISSLNFSVKRNISTDPGRITDREGSRPTLSEVAIQKRICKGSPLIFNAACVGPAEKKEVKIHLCQTSDNLTPYAELTLHHVIISGYQLAIDPADSSDNINSNHYPLEKITLSFDKIEMRYTPFDSKNQAQSPISAGYDLKTAMAA